MSHLVWRLETKARLTLHSMYVYTYAYIDSWSVKYRAIWPSKLSIHKLMRSKQRIWCSNLILKSNSRFYNTVIIHIHTYWKSFLHISNKYGIWIPRLHIFLIVTNRNKKQPYVFIQFHHFLYLTDGNKSHQTSALYLLIK